MLQHSPLSPLAQKRLVQAGISVSEFVRTKTLRSEKLMRVAAVVGTSAQH